LTRLHGDDAVASDYSEGTSSSYAAEKCLSFPLRQTPHFRRVATKPRKRPCSVFAGIVCTVISFRTWKSKNCHFTSLETHDKIYIVTNMINFKMIHLHLS